MLHRLQTGSLLVFIFFMFSDPKTTPNSRWGRILFGASVALVGIYLQIGLGMPSGLIVTLAFASLTVPLFDRLLPGSKYEWNAPCTEISQSV
jgi:Na+-translocating ferredoxin:NAD+ oxidoreductase RnfD subunit